MDDEYMNGQARLCGWKGTVAYLSLCRHVSKEQECFPSIELIAKENSVSTRAIIRGLKKLEERNVIKIKKKRNKGGKWLNNLCVLQDKSVWIYDDMTNSHMNDLVTEISNPCDHKSRARCPTVTIRKHIEGNTDKETHVAKAIFAKDKNQVNNIIEKFLTLSPSLKYENKTQRNACEEMLKKFGEDEVLRMVEMVLSVQGEKFAPRATTPYAMWQKIGDFKAYFKRKDNNSNKIIKV